jgi:hypothetical protein
LMQVERVWTWGECRRGRGKPIERGKELCLATNEITVSIRQDHDVFINFHRFTGNLKECRLRTLHLRPLDKEHISYNQAPKSALSSIYYSRTLYRLLEFLGAGKGKRSIWALRCECSSQQRRDLLAVNRTGDGRSVHVVRSPESGKATSAADSIETARKQKTDLIHLMY